MNNPYEDLEYLAEFLPEEGETVLVTRRRGQLICESYLENLSQSAPAGAIDREFYGRLVMIDSRLQLLWQAPVIVGILGFYWLSVLLHQVTKLGWAGWYLDVGLLLIMGISCFGTIQYLRRRYFLKTICPVLQKWMLDHQLDKYTLIAWLTTHRNLATLKNALTRWT